MDDPLVLAVTVLAPFLLGLGLRWRGAVLAALGLAGWSVALVADRGGDTAELTGAA
ncbi:MAG: hypothetical protein JWO90_750, partial [Solirubrobacterales bacterium]|nr:hypothetical protein [Solirubrobacterales bacterium]